MQTLLRVCAQEHEKSIISRGINAIRGALKGNHNHAGEAAGPAGAPLPAPSGPQVSSKTCVMQGKHEYQGAMYA